MQSAAVLADDVVDDAEELGRGQDRTADTLDRLGNEAGDLTAGFIADDVFEVVSTLHLAAGVFKAVRAAITVTWSSVLDAGQGGGRVLPGAYCRQGDRGLNPAMITVAQGDHFFPTGVQPGHEDGEVVGFATGAGEIGNFQPRVRGHALGQLPRVERNRWVQVDRRGMHELTHLGAHALGDLRVTMPH